MTRWIHPDRLDQLSATGESKGQPAQASSEDVAATLKRALGNGGLKRIPRNPRQRDVVLGLLCLNLRRRHPYTESQINEHLVELLTALRATVDHVTCRRYLVDVGFLKRDRAGTRYFLNASRLEAALSADAAIAARAFLEQLPGGLSELIEARTSSIGTARSRI